MAAPANGVPPGSLLPPGRKMDFGLCLRDRMTATECLLHPWIKLSFHMVSACNRLCRLRLLCQQQKPDEEATALVGAGEEPLHCLGVGWGWEGCPPP
ncbi:hypothetical protein E2320_014098 [Naja naja]|nr:hypothetical protein E2320_014098 [Naja naja]